MKTILTTILLLAALLTASAAMGEIDVTLETYDRNNDGMIDATERITLDIDIENARIRVSESMFEGGYTVSGTLILTDEFKEFAFAGTESGAVSVEDPSPSTEPQTGIIGDIATVEPEPEPTATLTDEEDEIVVTTAPPPANNNAVGIIVGIAIVLVVATGVYLYYRKDRLENDG